MLIRRLNPYAIIFLVLQFVLRLSLLARAFIEAELDIIGMGSVLLRGFWFDSVTLCFCMLPIAFYYFVLPTKSHGKKSNKIADISLRFIFSFIMLFDVVAEHLFWSEFSTRFNFIAIDYLVYTQEVVGNIVESYPLHWLLLAIGTIAALITWLSLKMAPFQSVQTQTFSKRSASFASLIAMCILLYTVSSIEQSQIKDNAEASELAANGIYNLFYAFWNNEIDFERFYATEPEDIAQKHAHDLLDEEDSKFVNNNPADLTRIIEAKGNELHKNVIVVVMESMSADYMGTFGSKDGLTPNLDYLATQGLLFTDLYATGTRTVRGLEALTLSIPPTPGQSIVRRPNNSDLFSLGFIFKDRGYKTQFIYGGYGYFDNMNTFFSGNGFDIIDRAFMSKEETHFANVWGICDEDMFTKAIAEADKAYSDKIPFMQLIMTTSNHRPFTYPDGKIDIESHSGRLGGVKYADYSVGKLLEEAKKKPWFKDTVFIFVADHTAGAGGKAELDSHKYHIPMIFYAPGFIKPTQYNKITSQIDMAPTLLGMLKFSYYTKFFGRDLINDPDEIPHAFISNFQKVGLVRNDELTVLAPKRDVQEFSWPKMQSIDVSETEMEDTISYYQSASHWKENYKRIPTLVAH